MDSLPHELVRACLSFLRTPSDLVAASRVSRQLNIEGSSDVLWTALYDEKWPQWTLLKAQQAASSMREIYRRRSTGELELTFSPDVVVLQGTAKDNFDGNETPLNALMCLAPPSRLSTALEITGMLLAQVNFGAGSLHNEPAVKCWLGHVRLEAFQVSLRWREHSSTFGHWIYDGTITPDGREISGDFYLSILPRKRGRFLLRVCDPATHVGDSAGGMPTHNQLAKRVAVKWCSSALAKAQACEELGGP